MIFGHSAKYWGSVGVYALGSLAAEVSGVLDDLGGLDKVVGGVGVVAAALAAYRIVRTAFSDSVASYRAAADYAEQRLAAERADWDGERASFEARLEAERLAFSNRITQEREILTAEISRLQARISELEARIDAR